MQSPHIIGDGSGAVKVLDKANETFASVFLRAIQAPTVLTAPVAPDEQVITVANTAGFVAGAEIVIASTNPEIESYYGAQVGAVSGNDVTLDTPLHEPFDAGAPVIIHSREMAVDGSVSRQIFSVTCPIGCEIDITYVAGRIISGSEADESKFGDLSTLPPYGVVFRKNILGGNFKNYFNASSNGDFTLATKDGVLYTDKGGGGKFGTFFSIGISGQGERGVVVRLKPGDSLEAIIQDDLTALESFVMIAHGHRVTY